MVQMDTTAQKIGSELVWYIEWGHDYNMLVDSGFYPDDGPFGMEAMVNWLSDQGFAHISATYVGQN